MRVYEYARKYGVSNKSVIEVLHKLGVSVQSHMAVIAPQALPLLEQHFDPPPQKSKPVPQAQQSPPPAAKQIVPESKEPDATAANKAVQQPPPKELTIALEPLSVASFAAKVKKPISDIILTLLRQGIVAVKNQVLEAKVVAQLARYYGVKIKEEAAQPVTKGPALKEQLEGKHTEERLPIIVVIGHVDHGKTTLLDFIRKTKVAIKEKGGITQHLGAYEAHTKQGDLVFLDTPGHEAFTKMRERGTRVADIAVLVVAADDGIMPQTIEAIKQAQAAQVPLVVAINKIDKATPQQVESVMKGLTQFGLVPEAWGGQTVCIPLSAKFGTGVDELLEMLVLQSKLMELTAALDVPARGYILEAKQEKGRGAVATVICHHGILKVGDNFIAGKTAGRVTSLINSAGKRVTKAYPSQPVAVAGFEELPQAGDSFEVVSLAGAKKARAAQAKTMAPVRTVAQEQGINLIIKVDNDSSREALLQALDKINEKAFKKLHVVQAGIGTVTESDIQLAHDTQSMVYALHTRADAAAGSLATKYGISIHQFDIIYKLLENLEVLTQLGRPVKKITRKTGEARVLKVFTIKGIGAVAGAQVTTGKLVRDGKVVVWRGKFKVGEGTIKSLQKEKKSIKEATTGTECAFTVEGFDNWLVDDRVECFQEVPEA
jgi:translation initiation factor IF-2